MIVIERNVEPFLVRLARLLLLELLERVSTEGRPRRGGDAVGPRARRNIQSIDALPKSVVFGVANEGDVLRLHVVRRRELRGLRRRLQLHEADGVGAARHLGQGALALRGLGAPHRGRGQRRGLGHVLVGVYHSVA